MRSGAWLVLLGLTLPLGSCSGGYPLPPTRCDEWCDVTKGAICQEYYNPASCVAQCEQARLDREECSVTFDSALSCFRNHPLALEQRCIFDGMPDDCQDEVIQLMTTGGCTLDNVGGGSQTL